MREQVPRGIQHTEPDTETPMAVAALPSGADMLRLQQGPCHDDQEENVSCLCEGSDVVTGSTGAADNALQHASCLTTGRWLSAAVLPVLKARQCGGQTPEL
jgi:hypothetical protein